MIENVILTEDDSDDVMIFKLAIEEIGYGCELIVAQSGEALFTMIDEMTFKPEVIFLDLNMPSMSGFDCLEKIRSTSGLDDCKVVILTTSKDERDKEKCLSLGADMFVTKPSGIATLASILKSILMA